MGRKDPKSTPESVKDKEDPRLLRRKGVSPKSRRCETGFYITDFFFNSACVWISLVMSAGKTVSGSVPTKLSPWRP